MKVPKVVIGPLVGEYGGTTQHIINIIKYSKYKLTPILPSPFSLHYNKSKFKGYVRAGLRKLKISNFDLFGLFLSKVHLPNFDIVHLHGHPYWPEIYLKSRYGHAKYIHSVHQIYLEEDCYTSTEWKAKEHLNQLMFESCRNSNVVISVAKWQQKKLQEEGIDSIYIPNGVNVKDCEVADSIRFRKKYNIGEDFYIFPGDIRQYKRPGLFVELAKMIPERKFIMIGNGVTEENLSKQLNTDIPKNVVCLGPLSHQDVLDGFAASRTFILPNKNETFGISLIEAMGCKKAVVASNNAGPKEIIQNGVDGFLFEPDNIESLYRKALIAWKHPEIGNAAYYKVKEQYDWSVVVKKIDELYRQLLS